MLPDRLRKMLPDRQKKRLLRKKLKQMSIMKQGTHICMVWMERKSIWRLHIPILKKQQL